MSLPFCPGRREGFGVLAPQVPSAPGGFSPQPQGWWHLPPGPRGRARRPARRWLAEAGTDLLTLGAFCVDVSAPFTNEGRNTSPRTALPHFPARCRHDLLHCLVIILSYPIMFFQVKNARTLLRLHLGILQHLEDGKEKKTRGNQEHRHQRLLARYLSACLTADGGGG